jgi:hypothetical protein
MRTLRIGLLIAALLSVAAPVLAQNPCPPTQACTGPDGVMQIPLLAGAGMVYIEADRLPLLGLEPVQVEVELDLAGHELKLSGQVHQGKYDPDDGLDLEGELSLVPPFEYEKAPLTLDLNAGSVGLVVEKSQFERATLNVNGELDIEVPATSGLKLQGSVQGRYTPDGFDLDCELELREPWTYSQPPVVARILSGRLGVVVEANEFKRAEFEGAPAEVQMEAPQGLLQLDGEVDGRYEDEFIDLEGGLSVMEPFEYEFPKVVARLNSGTLRVHIEKSEFAWAELQNVVVDVEVEIGDQPLVLEGQVTGSINESYEVSMDGSLTVVQDFVYRAPPVSASLASAAATADVRRRTLRAGKDGLEVHLDAGVAYYGVHGTETAPGNAQGQGRGDGASGGRNTNNQSLDPFTFLCHRLIPQPAWCVLGDVAVDSAH